MRIIQFFLQVEENVKRHMPNSHFVSQSVETQAQIDEVESCPICKAKIAPSLLSSVFFQLNTVTSSDEQKIGVCLYRCPSCSNAFMAQYDLTSSNCPEPTTIAPVNFTPETFPAKVAEISPSFVAVYNQALEAESRGLAEICGMGYRKSLEYLIKDYLISKYQDSENDIRISPLSKCIQNYIDNYGLKTVASRAVWLGNDFTHYEQRFSEYDIDDLKRFISATISWINLELTTDEALSIQSRRP